LIYDPDLSGRELLSILRSCLRKEVLKEWGEWRANLRVDVFSGLIQNLL
jgi:hypothetical protein